MKQLPTDTKVKRNYSTNDNDKWEYEISKEIAKGKNLYPSKEYAGFVSTQVNKQRSIEIRLKYVRYFFEFIKKPLNRITNKDFLNYLEYTSKKFMDSANTFNMYISGIKLFFEDFVKKPEIIKGIKWKRDKGIGKLPAELIMPEEFEKMTKKCVNPRDRALLNVMYDTGCRVGEAISLDIKHIQEDEYGMKIMFNGKTGMRRLRLTFSVPFLKEWLNQHPDKNNPQSPIFINQSTNHYGERFRVQGINKMLKVIGKRAGIKKNIHAHLIRHSRFTQLAKEYTEQEMKVLAGWVGDSTMVRTYVHLSGEDVEKKVLIKNGMLKEETKKEEEEKKKLMLPKVCPDPMCKYSNPYSNKYCSKCHRPLDIHTIMELESERKSSDDRMKKLIS